VRIINTLKENKDAVLNIDCVVGAGIARNSSDNHILGIAVYVEDNSTAVQGIPSKLGEFSVFSQSIGELSGFEKEQMLTAKKICDEKLCTSYLGSISGSLQKL
jgi:hypothetical protein